MTKITFISGIPGTDIDTYIDDERNLTLDQKIEKLDDGLKEYDSVQRNFDKEYELKIKELDNELKVYNLGEMMGQVASKYGLKLNFNHFLQMDQDERYLLLLNTINELKSIIKKENPEHAIIKTHSTFYEPRLSRFARSEFTRAVMHDAFNDFDIHRMCCIIDNERTIHKRLEKYPQYRDADLTDEKVLDWITMETEFSDTIYDFIKRDNDIQGGMQVFSRQLSKTSLHKFMFYDDVPVIYAAYPITAIKADTEIMKLVRDGIIMMSEYGIVKDPWAFDVENDSPIIGPVDVKNFSREDIYRSRHCVGRDFRFHVDRVDIIYTHFPVHTYSEGASAETWRSFGKTNLNLLQVGEELPDGASPFRVVQQFNISRGPQGIRDILEKEGYEAKFKDLVKYQTES